VHSLISHAQIFAGLSHGLALAYQNFGFTEFTDDLFGGIFSSWPLTLPPWSEPNFITGSVIGGHVSCMNNISSRAWQRLLSQLEPKFQPSQVVSTSGFDPVQPHTQSFPFSPLNIQPVSLNPHVLKRERL